MDDLDEDIELERLFETIYREFHYDFRNYSRSFLRRSVARAAAAVQSPTIADLANRVARDPGIFHEVLPWLTIQVSDFFRDPGYYRALREIVVPHLATYPSLRIWVAGCGTGEEVWSIAILLHEAGLLERAQIYATDIDAESLQAARAGLYELGRVRGFSENYFRAGGQASLSDYYSATSERVEISQDLRKHVLFSDHSLSTDAPFTEAQLISCRNVLIYFDTDLQDRAIGLFRDSLCSRGFLGLGSKERITFSRHAKAFEPVSDDERIYRKK